MAESLKNKYVSDSLVIRYQRMKEIDGLLKHQYHSKISCMKSLIERLGLDFELSGHGGCVNCLEWNRNGSILASGSDDFHVMLWDPFRRKRIADIDTGHQGNIFSVKFMPLSMDSLVASGAGDCRVKILSVEHANIPDSQPSFQCSCHAGRVKRLGVAPDVPYLLWSGAEDGTVMQFDLRTPHTCGSGPTNILINLLAHTGNQAEVKSIAINPIRTEQIAIGANDPYVRLYDRRMIKITSVPFLNEMPTTNWGRQNVLVASSRSEESRSAIPLGCAQYFVPAHLPRKLDTYRRRFRSLASTYVTFDPSGRYLLANLGGEQIYLYDCNTANPATIKSLPVLPSEETGGLIPSPDAEQLKLQANAAFQQKQYTTAIGLYSKAILRSPKAAVLYGNRAAACMKRKWDGDIYAALRDCRSALKLETNQIKNFHRLVRCFLDLDQLDEAKEAMVLLKQNFPQQATGAAVLSLEKEINAKLAQLQQRRIKDVQGEAKEPDNEYLDESGSSASFSDNENIWRKKYWDYESRYCGHCNTTTDIKEANFFGDDGQYIVAGSDDGCYFIWDRNTGIVEKVLRGDDSIVNCLQPHPFTCLLATSGIDSVVRLWSPLSQDKATVQQGVGSVVLDPELAATANQRRMNADPFEMFMMNLGGRVDDGSDETGGENNNDPQAAVQCRQS